jgi:diguanylate cyclase (GGDEF)-like protein
MNLSSLRELRRQPERLVALLVATTALAVGLRFIGLSMHQHAAQARTSAQTAVARLAGAIDTQLQALTDRAARGARQAVAAGAHSVDPTLEPAEPGSGEFSLSADGRTLPVAPSDLETVAGIASELKSADRHGTTLGGAVLGPMRLGSEWLIVVRAPIASPATPPGAAPRPGWWIVYRALDQILYGLDAGSLNRAGYDLEWSQRPRGSEHSQILFATRSTPLAEPAASPIHFPAAFPHALPEGEWSIALRPRGGWYPLVELATDGAVLTAAAWLLTLLAYDITRSSRRWHGALLASKRRLENANARLRGEIEMREDLQKSLEHARYHDAFTGLPNRRYFMDQLDRVLRTARVKRGYRLAVILVGIERFRLITDTLGHTAGDELMLQVARRFQNIASPAERVISRWSGDQFAVLLHNLYSIDTAMTVAKMLQEVFTAPFELRKQRVAVSANFGVTCVESGLHRAEEIVREADIALSAAQPEKGRAIVPYDARMRDSVVSLVHLEADLHVALERREFRLHYQPIIDLRTERVAGAEALLRWKHPVEGLLLPDRFIGIADEAGLLGPITRWCIRHVCRVGAGWRELLPPEAAFYLGVNLPASVLGDPTLAEYVANTLQETGTPPQFLRFEITEGSLISNVGPARELLERLHAMGISLMLDDFGTGYSSLSYLQLFPFDCLKIDRSFVTRVAADGSGSELLRAIVQLAASIGLQTVAEGIETQAVAAVLKEAGCAYAQGYFYSPPGEAEVLLRRLRAEYQMTVPELPAQRA